MSYCRFSTDDFQCDLYCYESVDGGYETTVAANRPDFCEPLPEKIDYTPETSEAWLERHQRVLDILDRSEKKPIGLPYDGQTFLDETLEDFLERLEMLKATGYKFPDYVIEAVKREMAESNS